MRQLQLRRDSGRAARMTSAAMADRKLATCHDVRWIALIAAPPVEKRMAATIR
jgi:hypothetical protein